jgi:hypothetical protein
MNTSVVRLVAGIAWAGLAVASAAPASARAVTSQSGEFASCSANIESGLLACAFESSGKFTNYFFSSYAQGIKFVTAGCGSGGCNSDSSIVYTDLVYPPGRKTATYGGACESYNLYTLGPCAC